MFNRLKYGYLSDETNAAASQLVLTVIAIVHSVCSKDRTQHRLTIVYGNFADDTAS